MSFTFGGSLITVINYASGEAAKPVPPVTSNRVITIDGYFVKTISGDQVITD